MKTIHEDQEFVMLNYIDISGEWGLKLDEKKSGIAEKYYSAVPDDSIFLPSVTSTAHKGNMNPERKTGYLTDVYAFEGWAWYYREIDISSAPEDCCAELYLERTRMTKLWINGEYAGECDSLCTPHRYDITKFIPARKLSICILVSNTDYPTKGGHMTSPDTQSNWNGITGLMQIRVYDRLHISHIEPYPDPESKNVRLDITMSGADSCERTDVLVWGASSDGRTVDEQCFTVSGHSSVIMKLGDEVSLWSEYSPAVYTLIAAVKGSSDMYTITFGVRSITADGLRLLCNGMQIRLRGEHNGLLFPETVFAPTSIEEWSSYLLTLKAWGLNHVRFHTCCPPEAAFAAADILGIYMQPELPFWGTISALGEDGYNAKEQDYLIEEGRRILREFGHHPSFVMMSLGNELWGSTSRLNDILGEYKKLDPRHLYTQGSNNFQFFPNIQPNDDFFSGVRLSKERLIRGSYAACDMPFGFVQTERPNTSHSYDDVIFPSSDGGSETGGGEIEIQYGTGVKKVSVGSTVGGLIPDKPVITHEIGQYCTYPDYGEIPGYKNILKPYNLEIFRDRLRAAGMAEQADELHSASGMLAFNCWKLEIEAVMRSENISGFQMLGLQDFTGQGTALVGMLNSLMQEKKFVRENSIREKWIGFCSDSAVLAEADSFVLTCGESVDIPVKLCYMRPEKLRDPRISWSFGDVSGYLSVPDSFSGVGNVGTISISASSPGKYELKLSLDDNTPNSYSFYAFEKPENDDILHSRSVSGDSILYITECREEAVKRLSEGCKVLYIPDSPGEKIRGEYCTDFWCYPMFRSISESMGRQLPVGTLGLLINSGHPALKYMHSEYYSTPQWYEIVTHSDMAVLDDMPEGFRPIVQCIDNFERNHRLGLLYEAVCGNGKLMICTSHLTAISELPEVRALVKGILSYMHSEDFDPEYSIEI